MWAYETTFYQIYPLGFCGAPHENAPVEATVAATSPAPIAKVADWSGYLQDMGIGAVLLNPVFESDSHGYDTRDLARLDARLGSNDDFAAVCRELHAHGIRVVLDAVLNHVGRGFWAFRDVQERRWDSPYKDWFNISFDGNSGYDDGFWYEGWEGHYELVKLNLQNPAVCDYLLECVRGWAREFGIDGLRLDVAYLLDRNFMRRLRSLANELGASTERMEAGGLPGDFVLIGETLHGDYNQIVNDEMLHSCTNYECYKGLYSSFNSVNMFEIAHSLHRQYGGDPWCIYRGKHLLSFADNHDVTRLASILADPACVRPAYGLLFGMPGMPCVYYGSEWGTTGTKGAGDDYDLRPAFDAPIENELSAWVRELALLRDGKPRGGSTDTVVASRAARALCYGSYRNVVIQNKQLLFERACDGDTVYVAVNAVDEPYTFCAGELCGSFVELVGERAGQTCELSGNLELAPYETRYLLRA